MKDFVGRFAGFDWSWYMPSVEAYSGLMGTSEIGDGHVCGENAGRYFPDAGTIIKWIDQPSLVPFLAHVPDKDKIAFWGYVIGRDNLPQKYVALTI